MRPIYKVTCDGGDITEAIRTRLLMLRVHDEAGFKNDRMELTLDNTPPWIDPPNRGAKFEVWMGYEETGMRQMGTFELDEGVQTGPPHAMTLVAHAKDTNTGFKGSKSKSWHNQTLGDIVSGVAKDNGFDVKMDDSLKSIKIDHIDQTAQSDMGFLTDLARNNNAVMKLANGSVYFAPKGSTKSQDGGDTEAVTVKFTQCGRYAHNFQGRGNYDGVRGRYWDRDEAKEKYGGAGNADGDNIHTLPEIYNDKAAAENAAKSLYGVMQSSKYTLELSMPGRPEIMAESPLSIDNDFPPSIPRSWMVDKAEHSMNNGGYTTIAVCLIQGSSGGGGEGGGTDGSTAPADGGGSGGGEGKEETRDNKEGGGSDGYKPDEVIST